MCTKCGCSNPWRGAGPDLRSKEKEVMTKAEAVLTNMNESTGYDMKKIGGGIDRIYIDLRKDKLSIEIGLYSGGNKVPFIFNLSDKTKVLAKERYDNDDADIAISKMLDDINTEVMALVAKELKTFESNVEKALNKIVNTNLI